MPFPADIIALQKRVTRLSTSWEITLLRSQLEQAAHTFFSNVNLHVGSTASKVRVKLLRAGLKALASAHFFTVSYSGSYLSLTHSQFHLPFPPTLEVKTGPYVFLGTFFYFSYFET